MILRLSYCVANLLLYFFFKSLDPYPFFLNNQNSTKLTKKAKVITQMPLLSCSFYRIFNIGYHWEWTWLSVLDDTLHRAPSESEGHIDFPNKREWLWLMLLWPKLWVLPSVPCERSSGPTQAIVLTHLHSYPSWYVSRYVPRVSE